MRLVAQGRPGSQRTVVHGAHLPDCYRMSPSPSKRRSGCLPAGGSISRLLEVLRAPYGQHRPDIGAPYRSEKMVQGKLLPVLRRHVCMCDPHRSANIVRQFSHRLMGVSFAPTELSLNKLALLFHTKPVI